MITKELNCPICNAFLIESSSIESTDLIYRCPTDKYTNRCLGHLSYNKKTLICTSYYINKDEDNYIYAESSDKWENKKNFDTTRLKFCHEIKYFYPLPYNNNLLKKSFFDLFDQLNYLALYY